MRYQGQEFTHQQKDLTGVLITNLGTPEAPTPAALRRYLAEFLSDPRVVEIPRLIWKLILHGIILRLRPRKSAEAYRGVWTERGSPLLFHTEDQCAALQQALGDKYGENLCVDFAMRYGEPSIGAVVDRMLNKGVRRLLVLPLYPQYSGSTSGSTFDAIARDFGARRWLPHLRFVASYHDFPPYIEAMAAQVREYWQQHGRAERLILSFHGVPKQFLMQGDPYHCQCHVTARLLAAQLGLEASEYMVTFQSRFGKAEWLQPYTDVTLKQLPAQGVKRVQMFCPGFSSDCLETLEEIAVENRDYFMESGGEQYAYIPALNAGDAHIEALVHLIGDHLAGWSHETVDVGMRDARYQQHAYNK
ncbi:MAG: ferrochelatase [Oleiphilus sp.]|nr:MAG: ferrochelatase [Oleiphilus sp.]